MNDWKESLKNRSLHFWLVVILLSFCDSFHSPEWVFKRRIKHFMRLQNINWNNRKLNNRSVSTGAIHVTRTFICSFCSLKWFCVCVFVLVALIAYASYVYVSLLKKKSYVCMYHIPIDAIAFRMILWGLWLYSWIRWACVQFHFISLLILYCHQSRMFAFSTISFFYSFIHWISLFDALHYLLLHLLTSIEILFYTWILSRSYIIFSKNFRFFMTFIDWNALNCCK